MSSIPRDISGRMFGWVTPVRIVGRDTQGGAVWLCKCKCGKQVKRARRQLLSRKTVSCGCFFFQKRGGKKDHPSYQPWRGMLARCRDTGHKNFRHYKARGITVCTRWEVFENFAKDMGPRPAGLTLGRIDNDKGYYPGNCRWENFRQQNLNYRRNVLLTARGKTMTVVQWADELGVSPHRIHCRLRLKWTTEHALFDPPSIHHNRRVPSSRRVKTPTITQNKPNHKPM